MQDLLRMLDARMPEPELYGWFHLLSLGIMFAVIAVLHRGCRRKQQSRVSQVLLFVSMISILLEVYKQININLAYDGEQGVRLNLQLYAFPWQFCSTPMYAGLLAGLIRKGRVHNALCAYLATYAVFAGGSVMLYPSTVFTETIGINIQTMFCHGASVVIGMYLFMSGHVKPEFSTLLKAFPVFVIAVAAAICLNEAAFLMDLLEEHSFNMFFISRHCEPELPVYSRIQKALPYHWSLLVYLFGFTAAANIVLMIAMAVDKWNKRHEKQLLKQHIKRSVSA